MTTEITGLHTRKMTNYVTGCILLQTRLHEHKKETMDYTMKDSELNLLTIAEMVVTHLVLAN